jgi:dihydrofolate reductase
MEKISLIVAMTDSRVIGVNNHLPWNIPEDLRRFKQITLGHPIVMGRKTFESIGRILPKRTNIVITRDRDYRVEGAMVCSSLEEALRWARQSPGGEEIFVIGGAEVFRQAIPLATHIYLTEVHWPFEGDTFFPEFPEQEFAEAKREKISDSPEAVLRILERKKPARDWEVGRQK